MIDGRPAPPGTATQGPLPWTRGRRRPRPSGRLPRRGDTVSASPLPVRAPAARPGGGLLIELPADPSCLRAVRERTRAWLLAAGWPEDDADDVVYAVSEAATNAIEHAYPAGAGGPMPRLRITGTVLGDARSGVRAELRVRDRGHWRPPALDPGHRGHGLAVMRSFLGSVVIRSDGTGTEVVLVSRPLARPSGDRVPSRRGPAPLAVAAAEVAAPAASARTAEWRSAHRQIRRRARLAIGRAAETQRRSAENLRLAEELVAAARARRGLRGSQDPAQTAASSAR